MDLQKYFAKEKRAIDAALMTIIDAQDGAPRILRDAMRYSLFSGGKRIRPIIALEVCRVCGGTRRDGMTVGCAVELVHTYSLIHDDLPAMDDDDYRRGKPACHRRFGEANAILAGDALLTLAFEAVATHLDAVEAAAVGRMLAAAAGGAGMVGGQAIDMATKKKRIGRAALAQLTELKTARLFEAAAGCAARAAGADPRAVRAMARYGDCLGRSFQLVDDAMDGDGYARLAGKTAARREAADVSASAKSALGIFGDCAIRLKAIADFIAARTE